MEMINKENTEFRQNRNSLYKLIEIIIQEYLLMGAKDQSIKDHALKKGYLEIKGLVVQKR